MIYPNLINISHQVTIADSNPRKIGLDLLWHFTELKDLLASTKKIEVIVTDSKNKTLNYTYYGDDYFQNK